MSLSKFSSFSSARGQIEIEFISLVGFILLLFVLVYVLAFNNQVKVEEHRQELFARQLCSFLASEVDFAFAIGSGFEKNLTLPQLLGGKVDYSVFVDNLEQAVIVSWQGGSCRSFVKSNSTSGVFRSGFNVLRNVNGSVVIS